MLDFILDFIADVVLWGSKKDIDLSILTWLAILFVCIVIVFI